MLYIRQASDEQDLRACDRTVFPPPRMSYFWLCGVHYTPECFTGKTNTVPFLGVFDRVQKWRLLGGFDQAIANQVARYPLTKLINARCNVASLSLYDFAFLYTDLMTVQHDLASGGPVPPLTVLRPNVRTQQ